MTNKGMKSVSGQRSDKTLAGYIEKADQARLAEAAMADLSVWESAVRKGDVPFAPRIATMHNVSLALRPETIVTTKGLIMLG